jgi:15-cis-phytoene synthase
LPEHKQRAAFALYAFCRQADDIVDRRDLDASVASARQDLLEYRAALDSALAGHPGDPVFREVARTVERFRIPRGPLVELLDGVGRDLESPAYHTWADVARYSAGVASSVGEMMVHVFGVRKHEDFAEAVGRARTLGVAMQLTNILRDVGEDAQRGRCYLPADEMARHGFSRDDVLEGDVDTTRSAWHRLLKLQVARARELYAEGTRGIALLASDAQRCAHMCAAGYAAILGAIERNDYDTMRLRAQVSNWERARIVFGSWRRAGIDAARAADTSWRG